LILLGGHINPAVTVGLTILGEIDMVTAMAYIVTQFVAAALGAALVWGTMYDSMLSDEQGGGKSTGF
jgi:glycerol uptake facilitator-like aquaporin